MPVKVDKMPILDKEDQPTIEQVTGIPNAGIEMFSSPSYEQVLHTLTKTDEKTIEITSNIDKKKTVNTIVSMNSYAEITKDLFRNIKNPQIQALVESDSDLIKKQIHVKYKAHKSLKGFTTNKIVEAISAKVKIADRLRAGLTRYSNNSSDKEAL